MKLDRNINGDGRGKYAILKLRLLPDYLGPEAPFRGGAAKITAALDTLEQAGILDWGWSDTPGEFMLIRLKDKYAEVALRAYADAARVDDPEYAAEIDEMASRAGPNSPWCKRPD